jgi:hypothetical protein
MADFKRGGNDSGWWVLKSGYRLPSDEDLRGMLTPEEVCATQSVTTIHTRHTQQSFPLLLVKAVICVQEFVITGMMHCVCQVCAYESGLAAYQRLRDAGYRVSRMALSDIKVHCTRGQSRVCIAGELNTNVWRCL